jgi:hypothetical protein
MLTAVRDAAFRLMAQGVLVNVLVQTVNRDANRELY